MDEARQRKIIHVDGESGRSGAAKRGDDVDPLACAREEDDGHPERG